MAKRFSAFWENPSYAKVNKTSPNGAAGDPILHGGEMGGNGRRQKGKDVRVACPKGLGWGRRDEKDTHLKQDGTTHHRTTETQRSQRHSLCPLHLCGK
jgi:hypothetical protein